MIRYKVPANIITPDSTDSVATVYDTPKSIFSSMVIFVVYYIKCSNGLIIERR